MLRTFQVVAKNLSMTEAALKLNQSKGSISYQIKTLENQLGFTLFERSNARLHLTSKGQKLLNVSTLSLDQIDQEIELLKFKKPTPLTIALQSYFLSRWLSPRLMKFTAKHPEIGLRFVPLNFINEMDNIEADISICWGKEGMINSPHERLISCPACPTANSQIAERVKKEGLDKIILTTPLLFDSSESIGWQDWFSHAGIDFKKSIQGVSISDSNSRVQAVIDGQGIALWDNLVSPEINSGNLHYLSNIQLDEYGYYIRVKENILENDTVKLFFKWIKEEGNSISSSKITKSLTFTQER
ncbi:LysR family transcriptional regulator [Candidatus Pelagibacter sp. HIMB1623]|uniref:LysR family transcriptional regulator n=1 Tax=Candidatus Pelagibacter sp. HIMB1623 TaxID=3413358 RepID=UPI003F877ED0